MSAAEAVVEPQVEAPPSKDILIVDVAGSGKTLNMTTSFTMTWKDPDTGKVKVGTFSARRPTLGDLGRIAVIKSKLCGGMPVDPQAEFIHEMLSDLQVILTDTPEWWAPHDLFDARPLREVWDHVRSWIDSFRKGRVG